VIAQCAGAVLASAACGWVLGNVASYGGTFPSLPLPQSFAVEMAYSGILGFVIMGVATDDRTPRAVAPFAIGATVFAGALVTGPLTGGSFNPARSFGPALLSRNWSGHWLYWFAPVLGMVLAMRLYDQLRPSSGDGDGAARVLTGTEGPL